MNAKIISFAIEAHNKVNHLYDGKPYSVHLSMVVGYFYELIEFVPTDLRSKVLDACWLHDTIEDCRLTYNDILQVAGSDVADIVYAVTNEKGKNRKQRANDTYYKGIRETPGAIFVKLFDRLANVRYSKVTLSNMLAVYSKEQDGFIQSLFPDNMPDHYYKIIDKLRQML